MKASQYILLFFIMLSIPVSGKDKVYDILILNDASRIEGHITAQHPGVDLVFWHDGIETTYLYEDILAIERILRSEDKLSGIDDIIETQDGKIYKGQIVKQLMGRAMYLQEENGTLYTIKIDDIAVHRKEKFNTEQSLFEQVPFLDIITTKDKQYRGVIVLQNYGTNNETNFLSIELPNGEIKKVETSTITEMRRVQNDKYAPIIAFKVMDDEVYFNRTKVTEVAYTADNKNDNLNILKDTLQNIIVAPDLAIEVKDTPINQQGVLIKATVQKTGKKEILQFGYQDMILKPILPTLKKSIKGTLRMEYHLTSGFYVLFIPQSKKVYVCQVQ